MISTDALTVIRDRAPGYKHHWIYPENDLPVLIVGRYETSGTKIYHQFHIENSEIVEGMPPLPYPLFGLSSLKNQSPLQAVIICEGEKCAAALHQLGWPAVSSPLGAGSCSKADWCLFRYFNRFIILRDNDKSGIRFAKNVAIELHRIRESLQISVVNLSPLIKGGDIVDWLQTTVLLGQDWDGFSPIPKELIQAVQTALKKQISEQLVSIEDCPQVAFKPIEAAFEGPPKEFDTKLRDVPPFPVEVFDVLIQRYLKTVSDSFSQLVDYAGTSFIATLAGLISRSVQLKMLQNNEWYEVANCWAILIGNPASKKSPILRRVNELFKLLKKRASQDYTKSMQEYRSKMHTAKLNNVDFDEPEPKLRRYLTDNVTMPKLRELMASNLNGFTLRNDELKGELEKLEKHGSEGDRSFLMSCWSGLEDYSEDRMCRDSNVDIPLALTWIGCIPPVSIQKYIREAMGKGSGADGFMQRFQFVCYPDPLRKYTIKKEVLSIDEKNQINQIIMTIDDETRQPQRTIFFEEDAQCFFDQWLINHENDVRSGKHPDYWESHLGKQAKAVAVLVIILHRLEEVLKAKKKETVSQKTLEGALKLLEYYQVHARRCYDSVCGNIIDDAKTIINLIREKRVSSRFKAQDIYRQGLGGLSDSGRVKEALKFLEEYQWLVRESIGEGAIGRNSAFFIAHPKLFENE